MTAEQWQSLRDYITGGVKYDYTDVDLLLSATGVGALARQSVKATLQRLAARDVAAKEVLVSKLPTGYSDGGAVGKEFSKYGVSPGSYRYVVNSKTGEKEVLGYDGKLYVDSSSGLVRKDFYEQQIRAEDRIGSAKASGGSSSSSTSGPKGNGSEAPYNSQTTRNELESTYGRDNVLSTTVPPVDGRNVHLAGQRHPVTGVVFDNRGFPIFDDVAAFDTRISIDAFKSASYEGQMKLATKDLLGAIQQGQVKASMFTAKQLQQINAGAKKIDGYTWHHHQDSGRMQLVPELIHSKTGHIGGEAMGGGM
ncbi:HNH endonuclease [Pseudomonas tohonis]|uniref:HNH endonuclease n=1 Tax=Pseudomonas tohonis TaxID=2725477 RepID=UPI001F2B4780|nr:HNH endonuclease [Pseudomonas tohonis]